MRMSDKKGKCVEGAAYENKRGMREVETVRGQKK